MPEQLSDNPVIEAERAEAEMYGYIDSGQSFIMEAGAGAGKTYSLKKALGHTLANKRKSLLEKSQRVACITFTEAATRELANEVDNHPLVSVSTIHSFCWTILKDFQPMLRDYVGKMDKWKKYIDEEHVVTEQKVVYDVGYRIIDENKISLHHDDVPMIMSMFLGNKKFQKVFLSRFPILFIDEYQDTQNNLMNSIVESLMVNTSIQVGLFGDSWQMIYDGVCGAISSDRMELIKKHANFRSDKRIVDSLNSMRPELKQVPSNNEPSKSDISIFLTDKWNGERGAGSHKEGSLPDNIAHDYYDQVRRALEDKGWNFSSNQTKILMLTNTILAKEQGYSELLNAFPFPYTDQLMNAEHRYVKLFAEKIEPFANAFEASLYGEMFSVLGRTSNIKNHSDKMKWHEYAVQLVQLRQNASIGEVVDYVLSNRRARIGVSDGFMKSESLFNEYVSDPSIVGEDADLVKKYERFVELRKIPYKQVIAFTNYQNEQTPFSTNHKVKGLQYDDVLVVISQSWNKYNFNKMLEWGYEDNAPADKKDFFIQNRNLFYVVCSRPRNRLAILFVRSLSDSARNRIAEWFGDANIQEL